MKEINREELDNLYEAEVDDAKSRYGEMVINTEYRHDKYSPDIYDAITWTEGLNEKLDNFDHFVDKSIQHGRLHDTLMSLHSNDDDIKKVAVDNLNRIYDKDWTNHNKSKRQNKIRKLMYEDAKLMVSQQFNESVNLDDEIKVKELWHDAKVQVRNDMTVLFEDITKLNEIEKLIQCRNNLN